MNVLQQLGLVLLFGSMALPVTAQVIRDDFDGPTISSANWMFCERDENEVRIVQPPAVPFRAAELTVRPRVDVAAFGVMFRHRGCRNGGGPFEPERNDERSELWEADAVTLPYGTEVWYRFSFMVDPATPPTVGRLVVGQWKQSNSATGDSPVLAQRLNGRSFAITIEQDNLSPDRAPADSQCRVWIAASGNGPRAPGGSEAHRLGLLPAAETSAELPSVGHDAFDISHEPRPPDDAAAGPQPCARDVTVTRHNPLPDPFGTWVEMRYHIRLDGADGLIEVWADGQPIATVRGRLGFRAKGPGRQYFKFGPYRTPQAYPTFARLARYARGPTREDIDW
jgi:hypothetical protein